MGLARPRWLSLRRAAAVLVMVITASLTFVAALSDILADWTWFSALGYADVFWITLTTKIALFTTVLVASTTVLLANGWLALHFTKGPVPLPAQSAWHSVPGVPSFDLWARGLLALHLYRCAQSLGGDSTARDRISPRLAR